MERRMGQPRPLPPQPFLNSTGPFRNPLLSFNPRPGTVAASGCVVLSPCNSGSLQLAADPSAGVECGERWGGHSYRLDCMGAGSTLLESGNWGRGR